MVQLWVCPWGVGTHGDQVTVALHAGECSFQAAGRIQVEVELSGEDGQFKLVQAALIRTARKILQGTLFVPETTLAH